MRANPSDQLQILDVQRMDLLVSALRHKASILPETAQLLVKSQRLTVLRDLKIAAQTQINDIKRELLRAEADVEQVVLRLDRDERRLADGSTTAKELEKLQHEIQTLSARRAELEELVLEIMLRIDSIKDRFSELSGEELILTAEAGELDLIKSAALTEIENEITSVIAERLATVSSIEGALVDLYEKVRAKNHGIGAAAFREGRCNGCHLDINSVELGRIKVLASDEVVRCEECGCILVRGTK